MSHVMVTQVTKSDTYHKSVTYVTVFFFFFFKFNNLLHSMRGQTVVATFVTTYNRRTPNMELKRERKRKEKKRKEKEKEKEN